MLSNNYCTLLKVDYMFDVNCKLSCEYFMLLYSQIKNKRFDWLISGPSKAALDRQKGVLDRKINEHTRWTIETF